MSHLSLDARAILEYLNELGYRNISAEQLKEFLKDLRKLIKYEEVFGANAYQDNYFEGLYKQTTVSCRAKFTKNDEQPGAVNREGRAMAKEYIDRLFRTQSQGRKGNLRNEEMRGRLGNDENMGEPHLPQLLSRMSFAEQPYRSLFYRAADNRELRLVSGEEKVKRHKKPASPSKASKTNRASRANKENVPRAPRSPVLGRKKRENSPRPKSSNRGGWSFKDDPPRAPRSPEIVRKFRQGSPGPNSTGCISSRTAGTMISRQLTAHRRRKPVQNDPVALYHYYQREWQHFSSQIPGTCTRNDLRWEIRKKILDPK